MMKQVTLTKFFWCLRNFWKFFSLNSCILMYECDNGDWTLREYNANNHPISNSTQLTRNLEYQFRVLHDSDIVVHVASF